ncbi:hypothetical protein RIU76_08550 [Latilactobacillus sakei subsp. sakei]|uniref:hypothetical protein n=1 Tax=Latilactobacillus TaxID=2767885 RepID=UPI000505247C|nr:MULTISPECIES: hypothetical protein [Latilactobacillus]KGB14244.1 hypothetical protein KY41_08455 [Latilactobacillus sakei]AOO75969.1 hypothetical protein LCW_07840 [Latilactobacillus curvatus]MCS8582380.1 hypothetical protein [Latilactobacillus curvatus]MCS8607010.1 hypothetical protein [Latilactobacillus curvatus]MCS8617090.1 hypothetical protein [Latilactobacillus curvatus]
MLKAKLTKLLSAIVSNVAFIILITSLATVDYGVFQFSRGLGFIVLGIIGVVFAWLIARDEVVN